MADQIQWLDGRANVQGMVEKICPKRHIRQNQWLSKWNDMYLAKNCYDYISDYECIFNHPIDENAQLHLYQGLWHGLQAAKQEGTNISIVNLAHFTEEEVAQAIIKSGGFRGGMKKINEDAEGNDVKAKFSWWSPKFGNADITLVRNTLGKAIQPLLAEQDGEEDDDQDGEENVLTQLKKQFGTSDAFRPNGIRYGRSYFQYGIKDLCDYYGSLFGGEVQFKILGTFGYKNEVMHAVLVCSQENGVGLFGAYPPVLKPEEDVNNEAVVTRDNDGKWVWKPQATATVIKRLPDQASCPMYRRWEHVAFAFHIPDERAENEQLMFVPELDNNLHQILEED